MNIRSGKMALDWKTKSHYLMDMGGWQNGNSDFAELCDDLREEDRLEVELNAKLERLSLYDSKPLTSLYDLILSDRNGTPGTILVALADLFQYGLSNRNEWECRELLNYMKR